METEQIDLFDRHTNFKKLAHSKKAILKLLSDGKPHRTMELISVGGADATRRVRELRSEGYAIPCGPIEGSNEWWYRLDEC